MVLAGETEVLGKNLPRRRHFVHHKPHLPCPGADPGRRGGNPATNRFSYGGATSQLYITKPKICLLNPVSLQTSYLICLPVYKVCVTVSPDYGCISRKYVATSYDEQTHVLCNVSELFGTVLCLTGKIKLIYYIPNRPRGSVVG
jgi:hypothetical protein